MRLKYYGNCLAILQVYFSQKHVYTGPIQFFKENVSLNRSSNQDISPHFKEWQYEKCTTVDTLLSLPMVICENKKMNKKYF